ncbi:MAG: hypothetical protein CM1200mP10_14590 [Candidatus Neomarinimicrobiota bacterium]|nr:MAG: hypothetical protein CM1200mP10_14590 [Candidatus Neomarinimicrobiota bacterium]
MPTKIGYASQSMNVDVPADGNASSDFGLSLLFLNLNEVIVTGAGTAVEKSKSWKFRGCI